MERLGPLLRTPTINAEIQMCDTILAPPGATGEHVMLFGKNSDRQRNEAQVVESLPSATHALGSSVRCTYISIPQARSTYAVLLCRPHWLWGAEMGANEHGVVIGNEALHARTPPPEVCALTGMDLLRLTLERAASAVEAVEVMTTLLEEHGQGGNCGHITPSYYQNGFMIADARDAFVVETVGKDWLVEKVAGVRAISNRYSIGGAPYRRSAGLESLIRSLGSTVEPQSYAEALADPSKEHIGNALARRRCSTSLLESMVGRLESADLMGILRDHGHGDQFQPAWQAECTVRRTLCMHAGADDRGGQTVGSMVSELRPTGSLHWVTASAAPCISIFKPLLTDAHVPAHGPAPGNRFDPQTLWWRHEQLHRLALVDDFHRFSEEIRPERDALEAEFRTRMEQALAGATRAEQARVVSDCWRQAQEMETRWLATMRSRRISAVGPHLSAWLQLSQLAGLDLAKVS